MSHYAIALIAVIGSALLGALIWVVHGVIRYMQAFDRPVVDDVTKREP